MKSSTLTFMSGVLAVAGIATVADAATFRMGGASAGTPIAREIPLNICDASPTPDLYINDGSQTDPTGDVITNGKMIVWRCNVGGTPSVFKYHATGSSAGIEKTQTPLSTNCSGLSAGDENDLCGSYMPDAPSSCSAPTLETRSTDGKQFNQHLNCTDAAISEVQHAGYSDVKGTTFGQQGPFNDVKNPIPTTGIVNIPSFAVTFSMVVGTEVGELNGGTVGPLSNLSRTEIESIFARQITDWRHIGAVTGTHGTSTTDGTSPITLCMREAGSGTKAAFDATVMKDATETPFGSTDLTNSSPGAYFGESNQDVRDCIEGNAGVGRPAHPHAIGYMEASQAAEIVANGTGRIVPINGELVRGPGSTEAEIKRAVRCGRYLYWVNENMNTRQNTAGMSADTLALQSAVATEAQSATGLAQLPDTSPYWESDTNMAVAKNSDAGPILWKGGAHPECND